MLKAQHAFISICACTYKRPHLLLRLLDSLAKQSYPISSFEVIIVDNDHAGSAESAIAEFSSRHPALTIRYRIEPRQGIAFARNCGVDMARGELLAFIDDDENAIPNWLEHLVETMQTHMADAVLGPVVAQYPADTSAWVKKSNFFERKRFPTGNSMTWGDGHTGNALVKCSWAKRRSPKMFNESLARSGGEDTDYFRWMQSEGGTLIWCDTAIAYEEVPSERQTLHFMLERSYVSSVTYWRSMYAIRPIHWCAMQACIGLFRAISLAVYGLVRLPLGLGATAPSWSAGAKALGRVTALTQIEVVGYKKK